jgi:hypothetical protein
MLWVQMRMTRVIDLIRRRYTSTAFKLFFGVIVVIDCCRTTKKATTTTMGEVMMRMQLKVEWMTVATTKAEVAPASRCLYSSSS